MTLADDIRACTLCPLAGRQEAGAQHVPATAGARYQPGGVAVLLDAPDYYEAMAGHLLTGKKGDAFGRMVEEAGLPVEELLVLASVRCHPPNNRLRDYPEALSNCAGWTAAELAAYAPKVMMVMGANAIKTVYGLEATVQGSRGAFLSTPAKHPWGRRVVTCTYHPAAASFDENVGPLIVQDLRAAKHRAELLKEVII